LTRRPQTDAAPVDEGEGEEERLAEIAVHPIIPSGLEIDEQRQGEDGD
jgi:hypothetical protein